MNKELLAFIRSLSTEEISASRKNELTPIADYISKRIEGGSIVNLNFICTHNSRRSHFAQVWAQVIASFLNLNSIRCYSGGTEATAVYFSVLKTFEKTGFKISKLSEDQNPVFAINFSQDEHPIIAFSKKYDNSFNPDHFIAIMTCDDADQNCPFIPSAEKRFKMTFEDPKYSDQTEAEAETYRERSHQIATEILYVLKQAKNGSI